MENQNNEASPLPKIDAKRVIKNGLKNSTYYRQKRIRREAIKKAKRKYGLIVLLLLVLPACFIGYNGYRLAQEQADVQRAILTDTARLEAIKAKNEVIIEEAQTLSAYDEELAKLGVMGREIKEASIEFGADADEAVKLQGLMIGIANAESSLGKKYHVAYDANCHNWWGLKGGNMAKRGDGSSLRCFINEEAGARTMAKTLKLYYLNEGKDTPDKIVVKYVGTKFGQYHDQWVANVQKYVKQ